MKRSPMRRVSRRKQGSYMEYIKLRLKYLTEHPKCECCGIRQATELHHKRGRGIYLCEVKWFMATCSTCHHSIETNREWAMNRGYRIDRIGQINE